MATLRRATFFWVCVVGITAGMGAARAQDEDLVAELGDALMRSFNPQALMNSSRSQFQGLLQGLTGTGGQAHASPLLAGAGFNFQQMSSLLTPASMGSLLSQLAAGGNFTLPGNFTTDPFKLEGAVDAIRDKVCLPQVVSRCTKVPAVILGPQFNITLSTGNCTLGHGGAKGTMNLTCVGPSISYTKAPITFVSKHSSGDKFVDSSCSVGKAFGSPQTKILFSMGKDEVFASTDSFVAGLSNSSMGVLWGVPPSGAVSAAGPASLPGGWKIVMAGSDTQGLD